MARGAFADTGSRQHGSERNAIRNITRLANRCRTLGVPVIHVRFVVTEGARGPTPERAAV